MMRDSNGTQKPNRAISQQVVLSNYFTINLFRPMRSTLRKTALVLPMLLFAFAMQAQDLSVAMRSSVTTTTIGSPVTFTIVVHNEDVTAASGVTVTSVVPLGSTFVIDDGGGAYDSGTGLWTVGGIPAGDSATLNITLTVATDGVIFSTAEVTTSDNIDPDSTPNNGSVLEDDWSSACITVPMRFNCRDNINVLATAVAGYTDYQWYLNGSPIAFADKDTYRIRGIGDYTYTASTLGTSCPASLCCPISVTRDSCMSLGNLVFNDKDNNGLFDGTDTGIDGVQIELWSAGLDGVKGGGDDVLDSTLTTANNGLYLFDNLNPGIYYVLLPGTGVPTGYVSSTGGGSNDNSGVGTYEPVTTEETIDDNDNGTKVPGFSIIASDTIHLILNSEPISEDGSANTNLTIDFGLYKPACISPEITTILHVIECYPTAVDLAALPISDNKNVTGALSYFATAADAVANTNPLSNTIISGVGSTTYWIRKEGSFAPCYDTVSVVVTINAKPVYADAATTVCEGASVNLTSLVAGYDSIVNPTWTEGGNAVADATNVIPSLGSTTYTLIGENASGCKDTADVVVTVNPKPVIADGSTAVCMNTIVDLTALITGYVNIVNPTWKEGGNAVADATNVIPSVGSTTYTLIGENASGCKDTAEVEVTVYVKPNAGVDTTLVCTGITAPTTYDFAQVGTWNVLSQPVGASATIDGAGVASNMTVVGQYFFELDINGCKDTAVVTFPDCGCISPDISASSPTAVCAPGTINISSITVTDVANVSGTISYHLTANDAAANTNPLSSPIFSTVGETTIWIRKTDGSGFCYDTVSVVVTINPKPVYPDVAHYVCVNTTVDLTSLVANYGSIVNPTWTKGGNPVATPTAVNPVLGANTYILIGENASGCKDTADVVVTVYAKPNAGADQTLTCIGVNSPTAHNFGQSGTWSVLTQPVGAAASVSGAGFVTGMSVIGQYTFEIDKNGCKDTVVITKPNCSCTSPDISVANRLVAVCAPTTVNVSAMTVTDSANVSGTLSYHATANDAVTGANPLSNTVVSVVGTTTMWIRKLDGTGFCYDTLSVVITINEKPIIEDGLTAVCENAVVDLTILITNYGAIVNPTWSQGGNAVANATNVTPSVGATSYTLIGENAVGCKDTANVEVTVYAKPNLGRDTTLACSGGSTPSAINFAQTGTWAILAQPVAAAVSISGTGAASDLTVEGVYTFAIDVNGCKDTVNVNVQICVAVGNLVWKDTNNNGLKDGSETGIPNIQVQLYASTDNIKGNDDDVLVSTKLTDTNGNYLFNDLNAGNYYVKLVNVPDSLVSSTGGGIYDQDGAGDYEPSTVGDVNEEDHGTGMPNQMVMSPIVNLAINGGPITDGDTDPNTNLTVDFGLFVPRDTPIFDLALRKTLESRPRGVVVNNGDTVRFNMTIFNQGNTNAYDIKITDYIPVGLEYQMALNTAAQTGNANDWQADSTLIVGSVPIGQSATVGIYLIVNHIPTDTIFPNKSEISFATADEGSGMNTPDVDSQADNNPKNDIVGGESFINNERNDEDDHDYAYVIDYIDHDPIGHIYCDKTGKVITGGRVEAYGPGLVYFIDRGESGRYQFYTDGTPGVYNIIYTHPKNYPYSTTCLPQADTLNTSTADGSPLDRDGVVNGTILLGSDADNGFMIDKTCANNTYYFNINITSGTDPFVFNNNIPVQCSSIGAVTCKDNNYNSIIDAGDTGFDGIKIYLENCLTSTVIDSTISVNGKYLFDGLSSGVYRIRAVSPTGYRFAIQNASGDEATDSDVDSSGYSACFILNFGECDTTQAQVCMFPNIYELALRKTLADGQAVDVAVGDTVTYNIKVKNNGTMNAYDVDIVDQLPAQLALADNNWTSVGSTATRRIPFLAFGDSTTVTLKARVVSPAASIVNTASVRGSDRTGGSVLGEVTLDNNTDSTVITISFCAASVDFITDNNCATSGTHFEAVGGPFISWHWDFGDGVTSTEEHLTHDYQAAGTYTVTLMVTDSNGCIGSISKPLTINPMVWVYAGVDRTICEGDSVNLHAQGGTHYLWTTGQSSLSDEFSAHPIATPSVTTTYTVISFNDYGCFGYDSVVVNVNPKPVIVSRTGDLSTCTNGSMPVSITLDQAITSYQISGSAGWRNVVINGNTITFDAVLNGSYNNMSVLLRGASGCSVTDSFNLYLAGNPRAEFIVIEPFCNNAEMTFLFTGRATPAAALNYSLDGGVIVRRSPATATRPYGDTTVVKYATFGSKLISLTVNDGGCTDASTKSIFVRKSPKTVISNNDTTICPGVCVNLYGTAGILDCVYSWTPATGLSATNIANPVACPLVTTTYYLTIMDINGCQSTDSVKITVNNNAPQLVGVPINVTVNCSSIPSPATVTELYGATVTFAETRTDGNCLYNYTLTRTWSATDACNRTTARSQVVTVQDIVAPQLFGLPANITVTCVADIPAASTNITALDACDSNPTISVADAVSNEICANRKTVTRTWTATDACGNSRTAAQRITVFDNIAPVLAGVPTNITISCPSELPPAATTVTATDNCTGNVPTITVADASSSQTCVNRKTITRTWTANDGCGNTATAQQVITVFDNIAPTFTSVPADVTIGCSDPLPNILAIATDNCGAPAISVRNTTNGSGCTYTVSRVFTATDACGNTKTAVQTVTVKDTEGPIIRPVNPRLAGLNSGDTLTMSCEDIRIFQMGDAVATDRCSGTATLTFEDLARRRGNCLTDGYSLLIECRWVAVDGCGNHSEWRVFLKVTDNKPPVLAACPANITVATPQDVPTAPILTATDNCTDSVIVTMTPTTTPTGNNCDYILTRTWTAVDGCGNFTTCQQLITVRDTMTVKEVHTNATCAGNDGTITMVPTQGLNYVWSDGATGPYRTALRAGAYTVTASRGNICQKVFTIIVGDDCNCTPPAATVQKTDATCSNPNGTATISVDNVANYTFTWSNGGSTTNTHTSLAAGNYTVTVTRSGSTTCFTVVPFTIINNTQGCCTPPVATVQTTDAVCGASNGTATIVVDNAANYSYTWSTGASITNSHSNLIPGNYSVTVSRNSDPTCSIILAVTIANNNATCCTDFITQSSLVKVITDCNSTADVCVEIPANSIASYTITDNGTPYAGGFGTCNAGSTLHFANGNHEVIFTNPFGCKDTLLVKVTCSPEIVIHRTVVFPQTATTCLTAAELGLTGNIVSVVNECAGNANFTDITIDPISQCISYKALNVGKDTACLRVMTSTGGTAYVKFIITVTLPGCGSIIPQDSVIVTDACSANPKVCVKIPFDVIPDYNILLNGTAYTGGYDACNNDTTFAYTYFTIPGRGATGPYSLDYWTVNGVTHTAPTVNTMDALVALMNSWDPTGHWMLSSSTLTIVGGDKSKTYGGIKLTRTANGSYGIMDVNKNIIPMGTLLDITRGQSTLVFINQNTGCADTLTVTAACLTPQYIASTIYVGDKDTLCIATNELVGTRYRVTKLVPSTNTYARFSDLAGTTCASRLGVAAGVEKATYVVSDEFGLNDTTYVTTTVYARAVKRPQANDDSTSTIKAQPVLIDILSNDTLHTNSAKLTIVANPKHGEVLITSDMRIIYTPDLDFCNSGKPDVFTYGLCDIGGCDTAKVEVIVSCDKVKIYNAFSPNDDGINDFFVIEGIEKFQNNLVSVYNRWGTEVMKTKGYKNNWNGKWNNVALPDGTYFYIFDDGEGNKKVGYVQIQR